MKNSFLALLLFLSANIYSFGQAGGYTPYWEIDSEQEKLLPSNAEGKIDLVGYESIYIEIIKNKAAKQEKTTDNLPDLYIPLKKRKHFKELYVRKANKVTDSSRVFVMWSLTTGEKPTSLGEFVKVDKKLAKWVWKSPPEPGEYAVFLGTGDTIAYTFRIVE